MIQRQPLYLFVFLSCTVFLLTGCKSGKSSQEAKPIYELLLCEPDGGGNIHFYEILTQEREIHMLLNDPKLKKKVAPNDILTCNFVVFNLGEHNAAGAYLKILKAEETASDIILTVEEVEPKNPQYDYLPDHEVFPYCVVRVYSKKNIVIE
jgi:hypothetical protein